MTFFVVILTMICIADDGAVEIDYKGVVLSGIDEAVAQAVAGVDFAARGEAQNRARGEI